MKRLLTLGILALTLLTGASAANISVRIGPPPPRREVIVARPGPRHVWVPGNYRWDGRRYAWGNGHWTLPPRGRNYWVPGRWERRNGMHIWFDGHWG